MTSAQILASSLNVRTQEGHRFVIRTNQVTKERYVVVLDHPEPVVVPADICGIAAGKDAWLSRIECKCIDCGKTYPLRDLNGGGRWCEPCQNASIEE